MKKIYVVSMVALAIFAVAMLSSCNPLVTPGNGGGGNGGGGGTLNSTTTTIQALRQNYTTYLGTVVTVEGTVICAPGEIAPWWAYIQNGSYGVLIDGNNSDSTFSSLKRGDKVKATGILIKPKAGYLQIGKYDSSNPQYAQVTVLGTADLPIPKVVTIHDLKTKPDIQGTLIEIKDVTLTATSDWPSSGAEISLTIRDTSGATTTMRIDKDTDIDGTPAPTSTFSVIGLAAYFNSPQILPRDNNDIVR